jgi:hypothetical protein
MSTRYASGKRAIAECDVCGFRYNLKKLKVTMVRGRSTEILACPRCWDPDHPQLKLGSFPVYDPQALRKPRPDFAGYAQSRAFLVVGNFSPAVALSSFVIIS